MNIPAMKNLPKPTINLPILEHLLLHSHHFSQFKQILSQMLTTGFIKDTYAASRILRTSTDSPFITLNYSRRIFASIENPNEFAWNTMMKAHVRSNSPTEVISIYKSMLYNHTLPDFHTFPVLVQSCALQLSLCTGNQAHDHVIKLGFGSDVYVINTLINMYWVCGDIFSARKVFDESPAVVLDSISWNSILAGYVSMRNVHDAKLIYDRMPEKSVIASNSMIKLFGELGLVSDARKLFDELPQRDMVSWTAVISCYEKNEMYLEALELFKEMFACTRWIDEVVIVSVLSACTRLAAFDEGKGVHGLAIKSGIDFYVNLQNACIDMYSSCNDMASAEKLFNKSRRLDLISWNSMISGYMKGGFLKCAERLFDSMPERDVVSWGTMISGYRQNGCFSKCLELFEEMGRSKIKPDEKTMGSVISACTSLAAFDRGIEAHMYIKNNGLRINPILGTTLIDMYMKCSCVEDAMAVFNGMDEKSVSTWNSVISGLAMNGLSQESLEIFAKMKDSGVVPNNITFVGVLSACTHVGLVDEGRLHFDSMVKEHNIEPNVKHYGCMVDLLAKAGLLEEAEKLITSMPMEPDVSTWGALLGGCTNHGNLEMGERIGRKLIKMKPKHDGFHVLLSNIHASKGDWSDVSEIRGKMNRIGVDKTPGWSFVESGGV